MTSQRKISLVDMTSKEKEVWQYASSPLAPSLAVSSASLLPVIFMCALTHSNFVTFVMEAIVSRLSMHYAFGLDVPVDKS